MPTDVTQKTKLLTHYIHTSHSHVQYCMCVGDEKRFFSLHKLTCGMMPSSPCPSPSFPIIV